MNYIRIIACIEALARLGISIEREQQLRHAAALYRGAWVTRRG